MEKLLNALTILKYKMGFLTSHRSNLLLQRDYLEEVLVLLLPFKDQLKDGTGLEKLKENISKYIRPVFEPGGFSQKKIEEMFETSRKSAIEDIDICIADLSGK